MEKFIPLSVPHIKGNEWDYVKDCLDTEWVSSAGKYVDKFEEELARYLKVSKAVCCINGTSALHIALKILDIGKRDEVIVPTLTFITPANVVRYVGAEPVFMDCDGNYNLDIDKLKEFIEKKCEIVEGKCYNILTKKRIKAVIPVHLFGVPVDMDPLIEICRRYDIKIIEDACEALGSEYKGRKVGTFGDVACFSFNGNKIMTTGAGGALVADDEKLAKKAKYLTQQAKDDSENYVHHEIGYNYRMTNLQAALGIAQLERLDDFIKIKRRNHAKYNEGLKESGFILFKEPSFSRSNYWFYCLQVKDFAQREEIFKRLKDNSIQSRPAWGLIHLQEPYKNCQSYKIEKAIGLWERTLNIPCSVGITDEEIKKVSRVIRNDPEPCDIKITGKEKTDRNDKNIVIIGGGSHAKVVINVLKKNGWKIYGYIDKKRNDDLRDIRYLGDDFVASDVLTGCDNAIIGINMLGDLRKRLFEKYSQLGFNFPPIISPDATVAEDLKLGEGSIVMDGVVVQPSVKIGKNCIINTSSSIDHDCSLGNDVNICPGVKIGGIVKIDDNVFVGMGAALIHSLHISKDIKIGAGAVVTKNLVEKGTYVGVPCTKVKKDSVYIIAEAGVNHNGDINLAKKLIDAGAATGVDAVKFQTFKTELLVTESADQAEYQKETAKDGSQFSMLKKLELTEENFTELRDYCQSKGVDFLSTPHSEKWSVDILDKLGVSAYKIGSGDLTNLPFLEYVASKGKPVILSTGMATMDEIKEAKDVLFNSGNRDVTILHCTTSYPCPDELVNLRAMKTIADETSCRVGYSDHTTGIETAVIAVTLGAEIYEKHFTLDKGLTGPDHQASLDPNELKKMVKAIGFVHDNKITDPHEAIRRLNKELGYNLDESKVEAILGSAEKKPHKVEMEVAKVARKSIIAIADINPGETLTERNIGIRRPGEGLHPKLYKSILGKQAKNHVKKDDYLKGEDFLP